MISVCLALFAATVSAVLFEKISTHSDERCSDGTYCSGATQCCGNATMSMGSDFCCPAGTAGSCCGDGCCSSDETCCPDKEHGGVCCLAQTTFCCAAQPELGFPSRCCPHWMVCCNGGRYGCCDPGALGVAPPLPIGFVRGGRPTRPHVPTSTRPTARRAQAGRTAFALLESAWQSTSNDLLALTIDLSTGEYTSRPAPGFPTEGETPKLFAWDGDRRRFHALTTNWSTLLPANAPRPVTLWSIDPTNGRTTHFDLKNVFGQATGYAYVSSLQKMVVGVADLVAGTYKRTKAYHFYAVDPTTQQTTLLRSVPLDGSDGTDSYAGWFYATSHSGNETFRMGRIDPTVDSSPFGVSITDLRSGKTRFVEAVSPHQLGFYQSLTPLPAASTDKKFEFLSLAPATLREPDTALSVVQWDTEGGARVLASLGDAHRTPLFGRLAEALSSDGKLWAALVVQDSYISDKLDRWALVTLSLQDASATPNLMPLSPFADAETDSVAGLGIV